MTGMYESESMMEESNVVSREGFIKYHLMDVYGMLATYGI